MSLEKTQLPDFLFADLFKDHLVPINDLTPIAQTVVEPKSAIATAFTQPETEILSFLGSNLKKIIILIKDSQALHINDEWLGTLGKLLQALKMNLSDVAIVNIYQQTIIHQQLTIQLDAKYVFLFDVTTQEIGLPFSVTNYQIKVANNCTYLQAAAVALADNKTDNAIKLEKTKLWLALKNIFAI
jgi:hypothetical protein